jgi:uncharacterized metal-binding protein YceD (DUF177 family)
MSAPELSRPVKPRALPAGPLTVDAGETERAALAARFGVTAIPALTATVDFGTKDDAVLAEGTLAATITQPCAVTREELSYDVSEPLMLRFVPAGSVPDYAPDEDLDQIEYEGDAFDLGEAIAQTLALAIDPYREGPGAKEARRKAGIVSDEEQAPSGPLAEALAALKKDQA